MGSVSMSKIPETTLIDGVSIPVAGLGTFRLGKDQRDYDRIFAAAVKMGCRMFDTAPGYGNEALVGQALRNCGVARGEVFISTKLNDDSHGYAQTMAAIQRSLELLQSNYIDLYLIHNPNSEMIRASAQAAGLPPDEGWKTLNAESWLAMEQARQKGYLRSIGVSNFMKRHLTELLKTARQTPSVNQLRQCVGCMRTQSGAIGLCRENGIRIEAHAPLGKGNAGRHPSLTGLAEKYGRSAQNIQLRYLTQIGRIVIPKASCEEHLRDDLDIFGYQLEEEDIRLLSDVVIEESWAIIKDPDTGIKYSDYDG